MPIVQNSFNVTFNINTFNKNTLQFFILKYILSSCIMKLLRRTIINLNRIFHLF